MIDNKNIELLDLKTEYITDPIGIDVTSPRFSWKFISQRRNTHQSAFQIKIYKYDNFTSHPSVEMDSGRTVSDRSVGVHLESFTPLPQTDYRWQVKIWDNHDNESEWSELARFETGLMDPQLWQATWIEPIQRPAQPDVINNIEEIFESDHGTFDDQHDELNPCQFIRKSFVTEHKTINKARLYMTAHGIYELYLNGQRSSDTLFAPGTTVYDDYLEYQTYDITSQILANAQNTIGIILADGWYLGKIGGPGTNMNYGDKLGCLLQMDIYYTDGTRQRLTSDSSFRSTTGPFIYSDLYVGEKYDARKELGNWSSPDYPASPDTWQSVKTDNQYGMDNLTSEYGAPVKEIQQLTPVAILTSPKGETIVDFGQNIAGRVRMHVSGAAGTVVSMEHCEVLDQQGNFLNNIMGRNKDQKDIYILKGQGVETYEPHFTFHGFRYIRVTGYPTLLTTNDLTAIIIGSDLPLSGHFETSDVRLNQLQHNILWSQLGNMISIPMDCPQRERAGWTGDIQIYGPTACFNMDLNAFLTRWLRNVQKDQLPDGRVPVLVPYWKGYQKVNQFLFDNSHTSAGWGDVCTQLPWTLYQTYGDRQVLQENYPMMLKWLSFIEKEAHDHIPESIDASQLSEAQMERQRYLWNTGFHFGDWLIPSFLEQGNPQEGAMNTALFTKEYTATLFYYYSAQLVAKIAAILGDTANHDKYAELSGKIKTAFQEEYLLTDKLKVDYQGIHVMALYFGVIPKESQIAVFENLVKLIVDNGYRLDTGFLSVPYLMDVLCQYGREDIALKILYQTECPSWFYEINNGATTMWESWTAISKTGTRTNVSYNHYAFGCIGDWLYRYIAGINKSDIGYKTITIQPHFIPSLEHVKASYNSIYGVIKSEWRQDNNTKTLNLSIPANSTADIIFPTNNLDGIIESGEKITAKNSLDISKESNKSIKIKIGSGDYQFKF